jgi:hypothetical protein
MSTTIDDDDDNDNDNDNNDSLPTSIISPSTTLNNNDNNINNNHNNNHHVLEPRAVTRDLFSATIGSIVCCYVGQPLDTIKVKQQTNPDYYSTVIRKTTTIIWQEEGIAAFWKGAVPTAAGMVLENCMAFGVNEALKRAFSIHHHSNHEDEHCNNNNYNVKDEMATATQRSTLLPSLWQPFVMGAMTGCCSATVLLPSEIIKAKTQITTQRNVTSQEIVRKMIQSQGIRSMCIGLDAQLCRDAIFYGMFFGGYELSCYTFRYFFPTMPEELNYFLSGGIAGMGGWFFAMPVST